MISFDAFYDRIAGAFVGATVAPLFSTGAEETPLMLAVCKGLVKQHGVIDRERVVASILDQERQTPLGNMHDVRGVFNELLKRKTSGTSLLCDRYASDRMQGACSVLYTVPLILVHGMRSTDPYDDVRALTRLTHADVRMTVATLWFGKIMMHLMCRQWSPLEPYKRIAQLDEIFSLSKSASTMFDERGGITSYEQRFTTLVPRVHDAVFFSRQAMPTSRMTASLGRTPVFSDMIPLAVAIALRNIHDVQAALLEIEESNARDVPMLTALVMLLVGSAHGLTTMRPMIRTMITAPDETAGIAFELIRFCAPDSWQTRIAGKTPMIPLGFRV